MMVFKYTKNEDGLFICPHCQETKKNQNTMHYHLKKHEGSFPHSCKHCPKKFLHKNMLDLHISARHPETTKEKNEFECPVDGCTFSSLTKANRIIHFMRMHFGKILEKNKCISKDSKISCKLCEKSFNNSTAFYYHASKCCAPSVDDPLYENYQSVIIC